MIIGDVPGKWGGLATVGKTEGFGIYKARVSSHVTEHLNKVCDLTPSARPVTAKEMAQWAYEKCKARQELQNVIQLTNCAATRKKKEGAVKHFIRWLDKTGWLAQNGLWLQLGEESVLDRLLRAAVLGVVDLRFFPLE